MSSNFLEGPLPSCVLESPVEELDVAGNELAGPLPEGPYDRSVLVALSAGGQRRPKGGLPGPLPPALMALSTLQAVDLSDGGLSGPLQLLPPNAGLFNVSRNQLGGELPALPQTLWAGDFSANAFAGAIPLLSGLPRLEVLAVGSNALVGPVPSLPPAITALDASLNQLQGGARCTAFVTARQCLPLDAALARPVRIAPRKALPAEACTTLAPPTAPRTPQERCRRCPPALSRSTLAATASAVTSAGWTSPA